MSNLADNLRAYFDEMIARTDNPEPARTHSLSVQDRPNRRRKSVMAASGLLVGTCLIIVAVTANRHRRDTEQVATEPSSVESEESLSRVVAENLPLDLSDPRARRTILEVVGDPVEAFNTELRKVRQRGYDVKAASSEAQCDPSVEDVQSSGLAPQKVVCQAIGTGPDGPISISLGHSNTDYIEITTRRMDLQAFGGDPILPTGLTLPSTEKPTPSAQERLADWITVADGDELVIASTALEFGVCGNEVTAIIAVNDTPLEATERYLSQLQVHGLYGEPSAGASPDGRDAMASATVPADGASFSLAAHDRTLSITICQ